MENQFNLRKYIKISYLLMLAFSFMMLEFGCASKKDFEISSNLEIQVYNQVLPYIIDTAVFKWGELLPSGKPLIDNSAEFYSLTLGDSLLSFYSLRERIGYPENFSGDKYLDDTSILNVDNTINFNLNNIILPSRIKITSNIVKSPKNNYLGKIELSRVIINRVNDLAIFYVIKTNPSYSKGKSEILFLANYNGVEWKIVKEIKIGFY